MKAWIEGLHGRQVAMLLVLLVTAGSVIWWIGYNFYLPEPIASYVFASDPELGRAIHSVTRDTLATGARRDERPAFELMGVGLVLWLSVVAIVWWWFGARKKEQRDG